MKETDLGYEYFLKIKDRKVIVFFGKGTFTGDDFVKTYPHLELLSLKQIHGVDVVEASSQVWPADSQWTQQTHQALKIVTADCMPIMIVDENSPRIAGLHAGWRGLFSGIVEKTVRGVFGDSKTLKLFVGPHIRRESFEVGQDALEMMKNRVAEISAGEEEVFFPHENPEKKYVDMLNYLRAELQYLGIYDQQRIEVVPVNTFTDMQMHSYRRDRPNKGQQISFVAQY